MTTQSETGVEQRRRLVTEIPGPRSKALHARRTAAVTSAVGSTLPAYLERAGGAVLVDVDGNQLIDLGSGIAVVNVGHAHPEVAAAVAEQAAALTHSCFMVNPYEGYVAVCERLTQVAPVRRTDGDGGVKAALFNSGAEAVENAVKVARHATGRDAVVVFDHAYHGRTNLTMAMTAKAMPYKRGFGPFASEVHRAPMSYPLRDPEGMTGEQAARRALADVETQVGADQVACVVVEPIQGEGGFIVPAPGFLPELARWCRENGALLVADEVQTGFARTGDLFACQDEGVLPDVVALAKGIAGGLPLAGIVGRAEVLDAVHGGGLGGTFGGNPVVCAAALAAMEVIERDDLAAAARRLGERITAVLRPLATDLPGIAEVRGRGAMVAIELVRPGTLDPDPTSAAAISAACHAAGVVTLVCGTGGNVLRLLPPLTMEDHLLDDALDVLSTAITSTLTTDR